MNEPRPDSPGTTVDEPLAADTDRTASDTAPETELTASDAELDTATAPTDGADGGLDRGVPASGRARLTLGQPVVARPNSPARPSAVGEPAAAAQRGVDSDARWREIQAVFVDDPRGSVERALRAVDDEVAAVIEVLRRRQAEPAPIGQANAGQATGELSGLAAGCDPADTERLRIALRDCRAFCADLADLADKLR